MVAQKYKNMVDQQSESTNNNQGKTQENYTRTHATGEHEANKIISKIQDEAQKEAIYLTTLKAHFLNHFYNELQQDGTYFDLVAEAFDINSRANRQALEQKINELKEVEGTLPKLLTASTEQSEDCITLSQDLNTLETALVAPQSDTTEKDKKKSKGFS